MRFFKLASNFGTPSKCVGYSISRNRYTHDDQMPMKRQSYNSKSQRFSRHKDRDRFRQERHTLEREKVADRNSKRCVHDASYRSA